MTLIEQTEKKIKNRNPITVKLYMENAFTHSNAKEFIKKYFLGSRPRTIQVNKKLETHCEGASNRSIIDLYKLTRNYYPEFTLKELLITLQELASKGSIVGFKCSTINRLVFYTGWGYNDDDGIIDKNEMIAAGLPTYNELIEELERENRITRRSIKNNRTE